MKKYFWLLASILMVALILLVSCGPATPTATTTTPPATTTTAPPTTTTKPPTTTTTPPTTTPATGKPEYGGFLKFRHETDVSSLDPILGNSGRDYHWFNQLYDHLVAAGQDFVPDPKISLAESWEFSTPTSIVFKLRQGVKFHDGTDFNADAVKFNMDRINDPTVLVGSPRGSFANIASMEIIDKYTIKWNFKAPWGSLLGLLADRGGSMNSPTAVQKWGKEYGYHVVGTGPFMLSDYVAGSSMTMVKNPNYWGKDKDGNQLPFLDKLTLFLIPDPGVAYAALQTGEIDVTTVAPKDVADAKTRSEIKLTTFTGSNAQVTMQFNTYKEPTNNVNLRRAMAYAIDPVSINEAIFFGTGTIAKSCLWCPGTWVFDDTIPRPTYDVAKAKEFLKAGGMPNGFKVKGCATSSIYHTQSIEIMQAQLKAIGVDMSIDIFDSATVTVKFNVNKEYNVYVTSQGRYPEPDRIASTRWKTKAYYNVGYGDAS